MVRKNLKTILSATLCACCLLFSTQTVQATEYTDSYYQDYTYNYVAPYLWAGDYTLNKNGKTDITWLPKYNPSDFPGISYEVELALEPDFSDAVAFTTTTENLTLTTSDFGENGGKFYFRVRTCENGIVSSNWSEPIELVYVKINKTNFPGMYQLLQKGGRQTSFEGGYETYNYDANGDGWLDPSEVQNTWGLFTSSVETRKNGKIYYEPHVKVSSLKGVEYLTNLSTISLYQYSGKKVDCSNNPNMHNIRISGITSKQITVISPTAKDIMVEATYTNNNFAKINLKKCPSAHTITAYGNNGTPTLILPKEKSSMKELSVSDLGTKTLDLNAYKNLQLLYLYKSNVTSLKINKCTDLRYLYFYYCSNIKSLDLTQNKKLVGVSTVSTPGLTTSTVKGYKNAKKVTFNSKDGKWWYGTDEYNKLKQSFWQ